MADFRYKSLKSWKIDNIDLTQQFSLSIFTDFGHQSIKSVDCYRFLSIDYSGWYSTEKKALSRPRPWVAWTFAILAALWCLESGSCPRLGVLTIYMRKSEISVGKSCKWFSPLIRLESFSKYGLWLEAMQFSTLFSLFSWIGCSL